MAGADWQKIVDNNFADERSFSAKVSDSAKIIWAGAFALLYSGMLAAAGTPLALFYVNNKGALFLAAELGVLAFIFDVLKNVFGSRLSYDLREFVVAHQADTNLAAQYNDRVEKSGYRKINQACYVISVLCAIASGILIAFCVLRFYGV